MFHEADANHKDMCDRSTAMPAIWTPSTASAVEQKKKPGSKARLRFGAEGGNCT
jgi:hypothetical protein